jgi:hypothetical protein
LVDCLVVLQGPARNRLLVKGGSSFNALVRAMKQDLIDNGTAAKDPALLYEIDKVKQAPHVVYEPLGCGLQLQVTTGNWRTCIAKWCFEAPAEVLWGRGAMGAQQGMSAQQHISAAGCS